jgi:aspartyl-tRNA(Asn)/glutamyl-tRNA(Gln) amidotransferase subunit A
MSELSKHPELCDQTLGQLAAALQAGRCSALEATEACLARQVATAGLNAYLHVDAAGARAAAVASDSRRQKKQALGPLDGIPMGLKDILMTAGLPTTCGSRILQDFIAPYDATVVARLKAAGMVLLGKQSMDEFGMGSSNEYCAYGPAKNVWDTQRVPGGSSGGSATSVAAGSCIASLGSDTGGSIRQPASFTGIVGLKPTYGRVSRYGAIAYASSLDQIGPLTKDVADSAALMQIIAGRDPLDATSAEHPLPDYSAGLEKGLAGLRIGIPEQYFGEGLDPQVRAAIEAARQAYQKLGAQVVSVSLPHSALAVATYYILAPAEASSNLARFDGVRYGQRRQGEASLSEMYKTTRSEGFGAEVKRRILLGTYVLSSGYYQAYYSQAQRARRQVSEDFAAAFSQVDLLLTPAAPTAAFKLGEKHSDPWTTYSADQCTIPVNLAGLPAISLPCGFTAEGLPIGQQLIGPAFSEARLLQAARAYEREHAWHTRRAGVPA